MTQAHYHFVGHTDDGFKPAVQREVALADLSVAAPAEAPKANEDVGDVLSPLNRPARQSSSDAAAAWANVPTPRLGCELVGVGDDDGAVDGLDLNDQDLASFLDDPDALYADAAMSDLRVEDLDALSSLQCDTPNSTPQAPPEPKPSPASPPAPALDGDELPLPAGWIKKSMSKGNKQVWMAWLQIVWMIFSLTPSAAGVL